MDKYEYKVRASEINELIDQQEYVQAAELADTIDWRRVKSVMMLCKISDLYKINRRYEDARDLLLLAYERRPGGRMICYSLCELSIKMEEYVQAIEYYKEYVQAVGSVKDAGCYILQYKLYEAQDVSLEERIAVLERLKQCEYREKWGYELAYLYHRVGLASRCVEECDELFVWFGASKLRMQDGKYVIKALELKMLHQPLTAEQQERYDHRFDALMESPKVAEEVSEPEATGNQEESVLSEDVIGLQAGQTSLGDTQIYTGAQAEAVTTEEELDIHVKTMDVGQYNTINLQAELAEGLREVLAEESAKNKIDNPITRSIVAPMLEPDTATLDYPEEDEVSEKDLGPVAEEIESSEVFFGETGEIGDLQTIPPVLTEGVSAGKDKSDVVAPEPDMTELVAPEVVSEEQNAVPDITAEIVMEQLRQENTVETVVSDPEPKTPMHAEPPKALAHVLSQEADGQIRLVMPEKENIEKQITGQISLTDILAEWERMKKENQEKREAEVRQHVLEHTGSMFTEFEAAVRDGLLEQLERGKDIETEVPAEEVLTSKDEVEEIEEVQEVTETVISEEIAEAVSEEIAETAVSEAVSEVTEELAGEEPLVETEEVLTFEDEVEELEEVQEVTDAVISEEIAEVISEEIAEEVAEASEEIPEEIEEPAEVLGDLAVEEVSEELAYETTESAEEELTFEDEVEETEELQEDAEGPEAEAVQENAEELQEVQRDKAKVRSLTREEKELYGPFIQSRAAREQLVKAIDGISLAAYTGNLIITGEEGMDTLTLAKNMIREMQATDSNFSGKVAKISGQALNNKDVVATVTQLKNGALIIAKATGMNDDTIHTLHKALQQESMGIVIVLEDTKKAIDKLLATHEQLKSSFTARMDVEALSNDMLVAFGKQYAREREYSIDELGVLALHTRIEDMQTIDHVVTVVEVKEIVDEAIDHANRKTLGHFFDILFAKRYDEEDMIILSEKDFV